MVLIIKPFANLSFMELPPKSLVALFADNGIPMWNSKEYTERIGGLQPQAFISNHYYITPSMLNYSPATRTSNKLHSLQHVATKS